jgi:hypothetical protein
VIVGPPGPATKGSALLSLSSPSAGPFLPVGDQSVKRSATGSLAGIDYAVWRPNLGMLAHVAAVTDVRLHVLDRRSGATWVCKREPAATAGGRQHHRPDGLVVIDGREVAVEVELTVKRRPRIEQIMTELVARYGRSPTSPRPRRGSGRTP